MYWSVTWEKAAFVLLILGLFLGFAARMDPKRHVSIMAGSVLGLLLLFCWIVIERFVFSPGSSSDRPTIYWILFGIHVFTGLIVILLAGLQAVSGGIMLGGARKPMTRRLHKIFGFLTVAFAIASLVSVIPL